MIKVMIHPLLAVVSDLSLFTTGGLRLAGLAVPTRIPNGKNKGVIVPVAEDVTGTRAWENGQYNELLPNEHYNGVFFFEQASDVEYLGRGDGVTRDTLYYEADVVLKGWVNTQKVNATPYLTSRLVLELTRDLTQGTSDFVRDAVRHLVTVGQFTGAFIDVQVLRQLRHGPDVFGSYPELVPEVLPEFEYFGLLLRLRFGVGVDCFTEETQAT